ncbi:M56 family metallopeptidase [Dyadobacter bucti]|uniref:M56 family metallopeptidase n=1 Tax=Dyadobacter bucti TaxID=2572203 RepID=UPI003F7139FE
MNFDIIDHPFFQKLVQAVCLTLFHSIWQGLLLAVAAGAVLALTGKSKPAVRYNLLSLLLVVFVAASGLTFWSLMNSGNAHAESKDGLIVLAGEQTVTTAAFVKNNDLTNIKSLIINTIVQFCHNYSFHIVTVWLLVFCFKSLQATAGFAYIKMVRKQKIHEPSAHWKNRLKSLSKTLGIHQVVVMMESEIITVPMVTGFFKPVILLPVGLLTNLSQAQAEAIILHELAHIRRNDYLVNLLQICCENLFFFNPALLWISSLIKEEREHCCDDLAIAVLQDKTSFIEALVTFQDYKLNGADLQMAFAKSRNPLLYRIKRIIYNNNKPLDAMEKLFVTASLITAAALSVAFAAADPEPKISVNAKEKPAAIQELHKSKNLIVNELSVHPDTLPAPGKIPGLDSGTNTYHVNSNDKQYEIVETDGKITSLKIDGEQIPADKIAAHQSEIDAIVGEIKVAHEHAEADRLKADEMRSKADEYRMEAEKIRQEAEVLRQQASQDRVKAEEMRIQAEKIRKETELMRVNVQNERMTNSNSRTDSEQIRNQNEDLKKMAEKMRADAEIQRQNAEKVRQQADVIRQQAEITRQQAEKQRAEYEKMQEGLIDDLMQEGVIKDTKKLSYKLSDDELVVNGVQQPSVLHQKMKAKYIRNGGVEMVYNWNGRTGYTITGTIQTR